MNEDGLKEIEIIILFLALGITHLYAVLSWIYAAARTK
jgi:hypothetical protein